MNNQDAINAARVIKEYCVANIGCRNCPFIDDRDEQTLCWFTDREDEPHMWKVPEVAQDDD